MHRARNKRAPAQQRGCMQALQRSRGHAGQTGSQSPASPAPCSCPSPSPRHPTCIARRAAWAKMQNSKLRHRNGTCRPISCILKRGDRRENKTLTWPCLQAGAAEGRERWVTGTRVPSAPNPRRIRSCKQAPSPAHPWGRKSPAWLQAWQWGANAECVCWGSQGQLGLLRTLHVHHMPAGQAQ
jgi:hypothetical protein